MKRVVVTGIGAVTPIGNNVSEYWKNLIDGKSGAASITRFDASNFKTKIACEVKNFDPSVALEKSESRKMDLFVQFAMVAANECMLDSGIDLGKNNLNNIGVIWGSGMGGMISYEEGMLDFAKYNQIPKFSPFFIPKVIPNISSGYLSIKFGLHGPSYSIASACASSNNALIDAYNLIRLGMVDAMLTGGSEAPISMGPLGGFNAMKALSEKNDTPQTASRPFDKERDGFVLGEGSGALLLEDLEHALNRNARIYCEVVGAGMASDAYHVTAPHPEGTGAVLAMQNALKMANLKPSDVNYINAHATSTPLGDISECNAIEKVFGETLSTVNISASKSMIGHLMGAAGVVESIACIKAIHENIIPPTINFENFDPQINPNMKITPNKCLKTNVDIALNNTFGFGGHSVTSIFKKYTI